MIRQIHLEAWYTQSDRKKREKKYLSQMKQIALQQIKQNDTKFIHVFVISGIVAVQSVKALMSVSIYIP